jgi:hypothetical protein
MFQPLWATLTTLGAGAATWIGVAVLGGQLEAWDSELYLAALPVIGLMVGVVSYFAPTRFWRWAFFPFLAQALVMIVLATPGASRGAGFALLPIGLIFFTIFGAFCMIPAAIGAVAGRKAVVR